MDTPDDFTGLFAPEPAPEATPPTSVPPWKVLLVDDEPDIHATLHLALQGSRVLGRSLELLDAPSANDARKLLEAEPDIAIILLDVVMESAHAGLDLVRFIREELGNRSVQIILLTGQPGYAPPRDIVVNYAINDYRLKSELDAEKIFVFVCSALQNYQSLLSLEENERAFRKVLELSNDAVLLQDSTAAFVDCNQAALKLLKMTRKQFINMTPDQISVEFQPNGRRSDEYAPEMTALGWKGFHRFEWTCRNLEGGEFVVEVSLVPITLKGQAMLHCTWHDITERKRLETELFRQARFDYLTGLSNRRYFLERGEEELRRAGRYGKQLSVGMMDIDNFKKINDQYGHDAGDAVLKTLADVCIETLRDVDIVGRMGGEEFAVLMPETDFAAALEAFERLREAFAGALVPLVSRVDGIRFSVSIGVANHRSAVDRLEDLLKLADQALYQAKASGKNRVCSTEKSLSSPHHPPDQAT